MTGFMNYYKRLSLLSCFDSSVKFADFSALDVGVFDKSFHNHALQIQSLHELMQKNNIRLLTIGNTNQLPSSCQKNLMKAVDATKDNKHMTLILALSYSARWEILEAVKKKESLYNMQKIS